MGKKENNCDKGQNSTYDMLCGAIYLVINLYITVPT